MRCISSEIEDMRKLDCSPAVRDSEANREQVGSLEPFYTTLSPDISQHKFSDHAYGDNPLLNPLLDEASALHCPPSRPFMTVMIGQAAKLDRSWPSRQVLGPAKPKKNQVGGGLNRHV